MCRGFPPHQQAILKHQESPTGLLLAPHTHFRCQSKIQIITWASDQLAINQRVPWEGSVNLLELLTELRETLTYIEHFIEADGKGNRRTPRWRQCTGWGRWEGAWRSMPSLGAPFSQNIPGSSLDPTLVSLWRLHHKGMIDHQLFSALSSFQEDGAENSKLPIMAWSFWRPALIQESNQSHLIGTKGTPITQEITGVSQTLCQERWSKTKIRTRDDPSVLIT